MTTVVLVGNPNGGKTTIFNALTGETQRVGNWPGVTVEKKTGSFSLHNTTIQVTDLPGLYSLASTTDTAKDAQITAQEVVSAAVDVIVNVIDASHLERHLYLTTQLLELGKPVVIALNMSDVAKRQGITINIKALSKQLNCPVVALEANRNLGITALKEAIFKAKSISSFKINFSDPINEILKQVEQQSINISDSAELVSYRACRWLEAGHKPVNVTDIDLEVLMADARYEQIHALVQTVQYKSSDASEHFTAKVDRIVLHRFWGLPLFLGIIYLVFLVAIHVGGAFQIFFEQTSDVLLVQGTATLLSTLQAPNWLIGLCSNGIGQGIKTTLTFIPVITAMFFLLSLLETSGYMARAAFLIDKLMRLFGLPGKSFVPMIVGFGCNVPGIMAARTLESERDRILTVLMSPFMSCSARLTIYAVFAAAFFPNDGQNVVFSLYLIGIAMAMLTGYLLRHTLLSGQSSPLILELPAYHRPSLYRLGQETLLRLRHFIIRAGKWIIPTCVLLEGLNRIKIQGGQLSVLAYAGQIMSPLFAPMGIDADNWPAVVGLLTGTLAKEVVLGTLNDLYGQLQQATQAVLMRPMDLFHSLQSALWSIPHNLGLFGHPVSTNAATVPISYLTYHFSGKAAVFSYLLFVLLYIPCVSTMAAIRQETNKRLMWFSVIWSLLVAYTTAVLFYQVATCMEHVQQTLIWVLVLSIILSLSVVFVLRGGRRVITAT